MDVAAAQERIDSVAWYHEFDFGNGLRARPNTPVDSGHRRIWAFIESQLARTDFRGKRVLDIGCWDGYWSFHAERRGASHVLATDDRSQNWADSRGIHVARELLGSAVEIDQNVSVYDLARLGPRFDVILFLGVWYHLFDPFFALAQIRHCCHPDTLVLMEGSVATDLGSQEALFNFADHNCEFLPHPDAFGQLVRAAYFREVDRSFLDPPEPPGRLGWRWRLRMCREGLRGSRERIRDLAGNPTPDGRPRLKTANRRMFLTCLPFAGKNDLHAYRPPFGLHVYDDRWRDAGE
jgi:tRNA (mo5U34)-methyltransferase